jgi:uncharacterized protein YjbJ (UPF0337 family)
MTQPSLHQLEREVETARAKLAGDLARLRSPAISAEFGEALKQEAIDVKDDLLAKAKTTVQSTLESFVDDVKARAAANPAAVLAIGAGVAWRLLRHPPVATALVAAGLVSLFRTPPAHINGRDPEAYISHAKVRLREQASEVAGMAKEQASELVDAATEKAAEVGRSVAEKAGELTDRAKEQVEQLRAQAASAAAELGGDIKEQTTTTLDRAFGSGEDIRGRASAIISAAGEVGGDWARSAQDAASDPQARDKVLLGAAGVAVVAALSIAFQRRLSEVD